MAPLRAPISSETARAGNVHRTRSMRPALRLVPKAGSESSTSRRSGLRHVGGVFSDRSDRHQNGTRRAPGRPGSPRSRVLSPSVINQLRRPNIVTNCHHLGHPLLPVAIPGLRSAALQPSVTTLNEHETTRSARSLQPSRIILEPLHPPRVPEHVHRGSRIGKNLIMFRWLLLRRLARRSATAASPAAAALPVRVELVLPSLPPIEVRPDRWQKASVGRVDALLDDPAFFVPFVPFFDPLMGGRPSTPMETYPADDVPEVRPPRGDRRTHPLLRA